MKSKQIEGKFQLYSVETFSFSGVPSVCVRLNCIFVLAPFSIITNTLDTTFQVGCAFLLKVLHFVGLF
jgi:hypothetical protein